MVLEPFVSSLNGGVEVTPVEKRIVFFVRHLGGKAGLVIRSCIQGADSIFIFSVGFQLESPSEMTRKEQVFHAYWKVDLP